MLEVISNEATPQNAVPAMRIIKVASCLTCTGKATLTYHVGSSANNEINFRVYSNTGGGLFSAEWISLNAIKSALDGATQPITSFTLNKLFKGRSTNTPGFLMAVLKGEGLVRNLEGKIRGYEQIDCAAFMAEVNALIASGTDLKVVSKSALPITKSAAVNPLPQSVPPIKTKKSSPAIEKPITAQ